MWPEPLLNAAAPLIDDGTDDGLVGDLVGWVWVGANDLETESLFASNFCDDRFPVAGAVSGEGTNVDVQAHALLWMRIERSGEPEFDWMAAGGISNFKFQISDEE